MSKTLKFEEVEALTLKKVPEIRKTYYEFGWDPIPYPNDEWLEQLPGIPLEDSRRLGATILFESILTQFVLSLFEDETSNQDRIREIMLWIENLALHKDVRIRETLVGVCLCEAILTEADSELIPQIFSYFGPQTKSLCLIHSKRLNLKQDILNYLNSLA